MEHTTHMLHDGLYHVFVTDKGTVVARVSPEDVGTHTASVTIAELNSSIAAIGLDDEAAHNLPEMVAVRNTFGTGIILQIMRTLRASMPEVKRWVWERKFGINAGRQYERSG